MSKRSAGGRRKKRRSLAPAFAALAVAALVMAAAGFFYLRYADTGEEMDKMAYFGLANDSEAALIINDKVSEEKGLVRNGTIYLPYEAVTKSFNAGFYWEKDSGQLLLTLPAGTQTWQAGDGTNAVLAEGDKVWISADLIQANSDIDMDMFTDPSRVVARTRWKNVTAETVLKDTYVRVKGGPKSPILTKVEAGNVVVRTANENDWMGVSTRDGYVGYVRTRDVTTAPEGTISHTADTARFVFPKLLEQAPICMAWQYVGSVEGNDAYGELTRDAKGLNVISPTWYHFADAAGSLTSYADAAYVARAHADGRKVWACLQDVYGSEVSAEEILGSQAARAHVIAQLMASAAEVGLDGINVDIETITEDGVPQYLQFLRELSVAAHAQNLVVSADNYVPLYTAYLNRAEQARAVDYLVIMGYDEHTAGSEEAGSVASLPFVEQGITDTLSEVSARQVINAIPFYTREWTKAIGTSALPESAAVGMDEAAQWAEAMGIAASWNQEAGQDVGSSSDGNVTYSIWLENEKSIEEKMKLIQKYQLAGVAAWRLGFERSDVWEIMQTYLGNS